MSEMIERVARALADYRLSRMFDDWAEKPERDGVLDLFHKRHRVELDDMARVAIESMRKPTEAMIEAGYTQTPDWDDASDEDVWRAMIGAALEPACASSVPPP